MKKILALLLTAAMLLCMLAACTGEEKSPGESTNVLDHEHGPSEAQTVPTETKEKKESQPDATQTRVVTDMAGRQVEIPAVVETAGAVSASARILTYAGCADKIVGLTDLERECHSGMPYAYVHRDTFPDLAGIASGGANSETYEEALAMLQPDVLFRDVSDAYELDTLQEKLGIPIIGLSYRGIFSDSVYDAITLVADVMGTQEHAASVIEQMKGWQKDLDQRTCDIPEEDKPSVYVGAVSFRGGHGIEGTYANYPPFMAIHAKNVVDETGEKAALLIDKEKLLTWDPDIIFLTPSNMNYVNEDYAVNPDLYNSLSAVKGGKLFTQVSYNFFGCNIELGIVDAYYAGSVIYPEQFADVDFEAKAEEIFTVMLGEPYLQVLNETGNSFGTMKIGE